MTSTEIGTSGVMAPALGLGTNKVGGHRPDIPVADGENAVRAAIDAGMNYLDTAYIYGVGRSEESIGRVLKSYDRSQVIVATKGGMYPDENGGVRYDNRPEVLTRSIDESLARLQTDYIDVYYIHHPDESTPEDEAVGALADARRAGKIRAIGVSNFSLDQLLAADGDGEVDIVEDHYSLVHRDTERILLPHLRQHRIAFSPYFPLAAGLLSGSRTKADHEEFVRLGLDQQRFSEVIDAVDALRPIAADHNASVTQLVLAWYLANPDVDIVIPGARDAEQVAGIAASRGIALSDDEYAQIDGLFPAVRNGRVSGQ